MMSTAEQMLDTTPVCERDWRRTLSVEAADRVLQPELVRVLRILQAVDPVCSP
jgi:hypothetical protein